ncbi:hypothetical protein Hamer_G023302 [Homarus americanus]|uniref:Uncharacterized protein n=1 Tax=Homarus americanus TaxID=6706 RepID=A0A8J5MR26_HOMAM|nr:hypothetical protein Hamer_G023302 [Homarus americanus]
MVHFFGALMEVEKFDRSSKVTVEEAIPAYPEIVKDVARAVTAMPPTQMNGILTPGMKGGLHVEMKNVPESSAAPAFNVKLNVLEESGYTQRVRSLNSQVVPSGWELSCRPVLPRSDFRSEFGERV